MLVCGMAKRITGTGQLTGHASIFRRKVRSPLSLLFTRKGHEALASIESRTGMSRGDIGEALVRKYGATLTRTDAIEVASADA